MYESHVTSSTRLLHFAEAENRRDNAHIASGGTNMSRFVEPYRFGEDERKALSTLLRKSRAGDEEGRRILIIATEYEIGLCKDLAEHSAEDLKSAAQATAAPPPTAQEPHPLARAAAEFSELLRAIMMPMIFRHTVARVPK